MLLDGSYAAEWQPLALAELVAGAFVVLLLDGGADYGRRVAADAVAEAQYVVVGHEVGLVGTESVAMVLHDGESAMADGDASDQGREVVALPAVDVVGVRLVAWGGVGGGAGQSVPLPKGEDVVVFAPCDVVEGGAIAHVFALEVVFVDEL